MFKESICFYFLTFTSSANRGADGGRSYHMRYKRLYFQKWQRCGESLFLSNICSFFKLGAYSGTSQNSLQLQLQRETIDSKFLFVERRSGNQWSFSLFIPAVNDFHLIFIVCVQCFDENHKLLNTYSCAVDLNNGVGKQLYIFQIQLN